MTMRLADTQTCTIESDYWLLRDLICNAALKLRIAFSPTLLSSPCSDTIIPMIFAHNGMYYDPLKRVHCQISYEHPHEPRSVQLFIKSIRNTTISIHIDSTSSISDLKHLVYAHDGIPPCVQRLMHRGRELRDDALLSGLDVDGATITCLVRVLGGYLHGRIPLRWWFGFSRSYQDGRAGEESRQRHALSEIEFGGGCPHSWSFDWPLYSWQGIEGHSDNVVTRVCKIKLQSSSVKNLPDSIAHLTSLTRLYVSSNQLTQLPESIGNLRCLTSLFVDNNQLTHLPESVGNLSSLTELYVSYNQLTQLPDSICNLTSLVHLGASYNLLNLIPDCIVSLSSLSRFNVRMNHLINIPDSIACLTSLTYLHVGNNPITSTETDRDEVKRRFGRVGLILVL